jgi:hypothetical protein
VWLGRGTLDGPCQTSAGASLYAFPISLRGSRYHRCSPYQPPYPPGCAFLNSPHPVGGVPFSSGKDAAAHPCPLINIRFGSSLLLYFLGLYNLDRRSRHCCMHQDRQLWLCPWMWPLQRRPSRGDGRKERPAGAVMVGREGSNWCPKASSPSRRPSSSSPPRLRPWGDRRRTTAGGPGRPRAPPRTRRGR